MKSVDIRCNAATDENEALSEKDDETRKQEVKVISLETENSLLR